MDASVPPSVPPSPSWLHTPGGAAASLGGTAQEYPAGQVMPDTLQSTGMHTPLEKNCPPPIPDKK